MCYQRVRQTESGASFTVTTRDNHLWNPPTNPFPSAQHHQKDLNTGVRVTWGIFDSLINDSSPSLSPFQCRIRLQWNLLAPHRLLQLQRDAQHWTQLLSSQGECGDLKKYY